MLQNIDNKTLAIHLLRISFGINYFFHGIVRLPNLDKFVEGMQNTFQSTLLPSFLVTPLIYIIPFAEIIIGVFLIFNQFTRQTLIATFCLMNIFIIGSCFAQKWEAVGVQVIYIGFLFLLLYFLNDKKKTT